MLTPNHLLPAHRTRNFVSATRVLTVLQHRLGCVPTGDRCPASEYWITPNGVRFQVADPTADYKSAPVVTAAGRQSLYYSYQYAAALLQRASWLIAHGHPEDNAPRTRDPSILLVDEVAAGAEHRPPRSIGDLADTIFI